MPIAFATSKLLSLLPGQYEKRTRPPGLARSPGKILSCFPASLAAAFGTLLLRPRRCCWSPSLTSILRAWLCAGFGIVIFRTPFAMVASTLEGSTRIGQLYGAEERAIAGALCDVPSAFFVRPVGLDLLLAANRKNVVDRARFPTSPRRVEPRHFHGNFEGPVGFVHVDVGTRSAVRCGASPNREKSSNRRSISRCNVPNTVDSGATKRGPPGFVWSSLLFAAYLSPFIALGSRGCGDLARSHRKAPHFPKSGFSFRTFSPRAALACLGRVAGPAMTPVNSPQSHKLRLGSRLPLLIQELPAEITHFTIRNLGSFFRLMRSIEGCWVGHFSGERRQNAQCDERF